MAGSDRQSRRPLDSHVYYFEIGAGDWTGDFRLRITDWKGMWGAAIGLRNMFLVVGMHLSMGLLGAGRITSTVSAMPDEGPAGVAANVVQIKKFGIDMYLLNERYELHPDGRTVQVVSKEGFGLIPFLFNEAKAHPARIKAGGLGAIYDIPLLGEGWIGDYTVLPDRDHIEARLTCSWCAAEEIIARSG